MPIPDHLSKREYDLNGWPEIKDNPISVVGCFQYLGKSIDPSLVPDQLYWVYRPEEELAHPDCIESFKLLPWIDDHKMLGNTNAGYTPAEQKGVEGVIGESVYFRDGVLYGNLKLFSEALDQVIEGGKRDLSAGYRCRYELTTGVFDGKRYDAIQRDIRGNHLASVHAGRMGPIVTVQDQHFTITFDAKEIKMPDPEKKDEKKSSMTMEEAIATIEDIAPKFAAMAAAFEKMNTTASDPADPASATDEDEDKKKEKEAKDAKDAEEKAAKDAAEAEGKKAEDKSAMDQIDVLTAKVATLEKGGIKTVLKEIKARDAMASGLAGFVGTFDHSEMTLGEVAQYGVSKLKIPSMSGHEVSAVNAWLHGRQAPSKQATLRTAFDASENSDEIDAYISGTDKK